MLFCNALTSAKSELTMKWQWIGLPTNFQNTPNIFAKLARPRPWSCWLSVRRKWVKKEKRRFTTSIFKTGAESSRPVFATSQWLLSPWPSIPKTILLSATIKIKRQNPLMGIIGWVSMGVLYLSRKIHPQGKYRVCNGVFSWGSFWPLVGVSTDSSDNIH